VHETFRIDLNPKSGGLAMRGSRRTKFCSLLRQRCGGGGGGVRGWGGGGSGGAGWGVLQRGVVNDGQVTNDRNGATDRE